MAGSPKTPRRPLTKAKRAARRRRRLRLLGGVALALALGAAWVWQRTLPLRAIDVVDAVHADPDAVVRLTGAEPDSVALFSLGPALMADRAQRQPWVETAHVRRLPTGTLQIRVTERTPVALVLGADGAPSHFLDGAGYAMPAVDGALADVPLVTGAPPYHPTQPVADADLREWLAALAAASAETQALVDAVDWGRAPTLTTAPAGGHGAVTVRLPRRGAAGALVRLRAFWDQSVLPRPAERFALVDLRFDGQVITREGRPRTGSGATPVRAASVSDSTSAPSPDADRVEAPAPSSSPRTARAPAATTDGA